MDRAHYKEIIEKYLSGNISDGEIKELSDWMKQDPNLQEWLESEFMRASDNLSEEQQRLIWKKIREQTSNEIHSRFSLQHMNKKFYKSIGKWAAVIIIPICIFLSLHYSFSEPSTFTTSPITITADKGNRTSVDLPDGTTVILNSASSITYESDFGKTDRRVSLEGEAFFQVKHDDKKAFIVRTSNLDVKVFGTKFNVAAYKDSKDIFVVLIEGKIGVFAPNLSHIMKPGEKIDYDKVKGNIRSTKVYPQDYIEWTKGNLYFENESLENIMKTFSRIYGVTIHFNSEKLPKDHFTGTIPNGSIQNSLNILMLTSHFKYEVEGSTIMIKESK